jgi:mttA/Hcf106 family protein
LKDCFSPRICWSFLVSPCSSLAKKLPELGKGIGEGIRGFKSAIKAEEDKPETVVPPATDPDLSKN